nr:putative late blight resistance protein homolog R1A-10 [Ipomoea batatas]
MKPGCSSIQITSMCFDKLHSLHSVGHVDLSKKLLCQFKLLRVVDVKLALWNFEYIGVYMANLVHLRYLALSGNYTAIRVELKLFEHWNMQSFIVRASCVELCSHEASRIWKMPLLRNFYVDTIPFILEASEVVHKNIESISWLHPKCCTEDLFTRIPNLKKLGIKGWSFEHQSSDGFYNFVHLGQLEKLSIKSWRLKLPYSGIPWATSFLQNLKKLKFYETCLAWSEIRLIGMLPNLEILKLIEACEGREWEPCEGGFRQLKRLVIKNRSLKNWNAVGDHFPVLEHLELSYCTALREIPIELTDITTLALIKLTGCFPSLLASAKRIQDEQRSYGNEALLVASGSLRVSYVKLAEQVANLLTKQLGHRLFAAFRTKIGLTYASSALISLSQMAYAAVTSLKGTLHLHFLQSQPRLPLPHKPEILNSLHENLGSLQEILEKSEIPNDNSAMKGLEAEIRDVLFKAEERIEMELSSIYLAKGRWKRLRIKASLLKLRGIFNQAVTQTDYLKKKLIKSEKQLAKGPSQDERMQQRGLLLDVDRLFPNFKLLRVLDIEGLNSARYMVLNALADLIHLRYLALSYTPKAPLFGLKLFEHWNMQSFIVRGTNVALDSSRTSGIWKMPLLRNFYLEELSIREWRNLNHIPCSGIPWATGFLPNLKKLKFFFTNLAWSDMRLIGMLPNLEVLKLINAIASEDIMWEPSEEGFRQLKRLVIDDDSLERWNAVGDHFPVLECLKLWSCFSLQEIPSGFADITTLALIELYLCRDSVLASAKLIQEEQYNNYGNALLKEGGNNSEEEWDEEEESDELMAA